MADEAQKDYDFVVIRTRKSDGTVTTISCKSTDYFKLCRNYPNNTDRLLAIRSASTRYDDERAAGKAKGTRSAYIRKALLN
jgi:hypothetical protein